MRTGRAALVMALRSLGLPKGGRIGVPLFCCPVVFEAIFTADCRPVFLDIDPTTYCLSAASLGTQRSKVDAVITVHMFGHIAGIENLKTVLEGKPLIEDCAQSLGSAFRGYPAGTWGDVAVFSFRSAKYISAGEGGALYSRNPRLWRYLQVAASGFPQRERAWELIHVVSVYTKSLLRRRPLYGMLGRGLWEFVNRRTNEIKEPSIDMSRIYRSDLAVVRKRLIALNRSIAKQRENAEIYMSQLELEPNMLSYESPGAYYNRLQFPLFFPSERIRDLMSDFLAQRGIDSTKYLGNLVPVTRKYYGYRGGCPQSERASKRVLTVPVYHTLRRADIEKIAGCVNDGWRSVRT